VFIFESEKSGDQAWLQLAKNTFKRVKTIRHPNTLKFLDGVEVWSRHSSECSSLPLNDLLNWDWIGLDGQHGDHCH